MAAAKVANFIRGDSTAIAPGGYFLRPSLGLLVGRADARAGLAYPHATRTVASARGSSKVSPTLSLNGRRSSPSSTLAGGALITRTLMMKTAAAAARVECTRHAKIINKQT